MWNPKPSEIVSMRAREEVGREIWMDRGRAGEKECKKRGHLCYSEILALGQQQVLYKNMRLLDIQLVTAPMESHWDTRHSEGHTTLPVDDKHKMNSVVFGEVLCLIMLCLGFFSYSSLFLLCLILFHFIIILLLLVFQWRGVDPDGKWGGGDLGRVEKGETEL